MEVVSDSVIGQFLSPQEIQRMELGLPRISDWGEHLLVPFSARRLRGARVVWVNHRWFLGRSIDIMHSSTRARVVKWLLHEFGYISPHPQDSESAFTIEEKTFYADRYGSTNGTSPHGGSGRVGSIGCFQAKGIGITPLAAGEVSWDYSHGCASLEEAIREAIYAEISCAEFPHGAIPVIAILDCGLQFPEKVRFEKSLKEQRRALIVRPNVIRPAHAERAPLFNQSATGFVNIQSDDVERTREAVRRWVNSRRAGESWSDLLEEHFGKVAQQVAFGQVHRLFNGGYFSSNVSISGALLDFGNMHVFTNWVNSRVLAHVVGFGDEMKMVMKTIRSIIFYFNKYGGSSRSELSEEYLSNGVMASYEDAFKAECLRLWHLDDIADGALADGVLAVVKRYFSAQQKHRVTYKFGVVAKQHTDGDRHEWWYDAITESGRQDNRGLQALCDIDKFIRERFGSSPEGVKRRSLAWGTAARFLKPRHGLNRGFLMQGVGQAVSKSDFLPSDDTFATNVIRSVVSAGRRHWKALPREFVVHAHVTVDGSSALYCFDVAHGRHVLWLEGLCVGVKFRFFDSWIARQIVDELVPRISGEYWSASVSVDSFDPRVEQVVHIKSTGITVPAMHVEYEAPASRWTSQS